MTSTDSEAHCRPGGGEGPGAAAQSRRAAAMQTQREETASFALDIG